MSGFCAKMDTSRKFTRMKKNLRVRGSAVSAPPWRKDSPPGGAYLPSRPRRSLPRCFRHVAWLAERLQVAFVVIPTVCERDHVVDFLCCGRPARSHAFDTKRVVVQPLLTASHPHRAALPWGRTDPRHVRQAAAQRRQTTLQRFEFHRVPAAGCVRFSAPRALHPLGHRPPPFGRCILKSKSPRPSGGGLHRD